MLPIIELEIVGVSIPPTTTLTVSAIRSNTSLILSAPKNFNPGQTFKIFFLNSYFDVDF